MLRIEFSATSSIGGHLMSSSIKGRLVSSLAPTMDGDHQFDTFDERSYSPAITFPAREKLIAELRETLTVLAAEVAESSTYCMLLLDELSQYQRSDGEVVTCGLSAVSKEDAMDRTQQLINNSRVRIVSLNQQIARVEEELAAVIDDSEAAIGSEIAPAAFNLAVSACC